MDEDFSATVVFDSPFGLITTTCKKLLQFNQDDVTHQSEPKKSVTWDSKLVPEDSDKEKKKVKKSVILAPPKPSSVPTQSKTKKNVPMPAITSLFMTSKKNRTKVFSGNTQNRAPKREIPTLLALCVRFIDAKKEQIMGFGLLSRDMITKVLRRATVNQLLSIESKDASLIEGKLTDDLWKFHYNKDFKIVPESSSKTSWRSLYLDANKTKNNKLDESKKKNIKITLNSSTSKSVSTSRSKSSRIILLENDMFSEALNSQSLKRKRSNDVQKNKKKNKN